MAKKYAPVSARRLRAMKRQVQQIMVDSDFQEVRDEEHLEQYLAAESARYSARIALELFRQIDYLKNQLDQAAVPLAYRA